MSTPVVDTPWWQFLNNASIAAFVGAFAAFILVVANDWRRRRRSKSQIRFLVSDNLEHARRKLVTVQTNLDMIRNNRFMPAPIMPFPVNTLKNKQFEVIDLLDSNENRSLDALLYWTAAIDGLLSDFRAGANELRRAVEMGADNETRTRLGGRMLTELGDAERNLHLLIGLCESFIGHRYHEILEFQHPIDNRK